MKFVVNRLLLVLAFSLLVSSITSSQSPDSQRSSAITDAASVSSCECVECPADEIAVCHYNSGQCKGKCVRLRPLITKMDVVAALLTEVLNHEVSYDDLNESPKTYSKILDQLIASKGQPIEIDFDGKTLKVGIDLSHKAARDLIQAVSKELKVSPRG